MAKTFQFELVTPENLLFSETVEEVILPSCTGYLTIMLNHSPVITRITPGFLHIRAIEKAEQVFVVFGGFVDIRPAICSLLTTTIMPIEQLDPDDIDRRIAEAHSEFKIAKTDAHRNKIEEFLYQLSVIRDIERFV
ncbi:MAG: F-type H+-transporting ATPase subunit epsilon [Candidatus Tokpelaia sp. JSC188]|nr:MAG: F-type H+-transporting ATPase subunit epsilon [Candidatus Tokpelaia sp. JSC188]